MVQDKSALTGRNILLVEDEALIAMELEDALLTSGAEVFGPAARIEAALVIARKDPLDAAILDMDLDGLEVFPVADCLRARGIPFLFHTGHGQRRETCEVYGDAPVVKKPAPTHEILSTLSSLIGKLV